MSGPWQKFSAEDWKNARYCGECGLPLIKIETGETMCVFCTWQEDETVIAGQAVRQAEKEKTEAIEHMQNTMRIMKMQQINEVTRLIEAINWQHAAYGDVPVPGTMYEVWQNDLFAVDRYNEGFYWESGITPTWWRPLINPEEIHTPRISASDTRIY